MFREYLVRLSNPEKKIPVPLCCFSKNRKELGNIRNVACEVTESPGSLPFWTHTIPLKNYSVENSDENKLAQIKEPPHTHVSYWAAATCTGLILFIVYLTTLSIAETIQLRVVKVKISNVVPVLN
jgi:hypothetical protein